MWKNYLKATLRSLKSRKVISGINIIGLAFGISAFLLIIKYISYERSFDKFQDDYESIYRVSLDIYQDNEQVMVTAENFPGVAPAMLEEIPEVINYARLYNMGYKNNVVITYEDAPGGPIAFKNRSFLYADSSLLEMMGYEFVEGDPATALNEPFSTVISETTARKYFGDESALGKMLRLQDDDYNDELAKVTGVFRDLPDNTHLKFEVLFSYNTLYTRGDWARGRYHQSWSRQDMYTYIKLRDGADPADVEAKIPALVEKFAADAAERNIEYKMALQPLQDIHLTSNIAEEYQSNGDARIVNFMVIIAILIVVIAWINYINLTTAQAMERAGEVGVRKVMGAFKGQLMSQFLFESLFVNLTAILIAFLAIALILPSFNALTGVNFEFVNFLEPGFLAIVATLWILGSVLSGFYPSIVLSSFKPASVIKGKLRHTGAGAILRKSLVVLQFAACVSLIAATLLVKGQMDFLKDQDLGMNIEKVLVVERPAVNPIVNDDEEATRNARREQMDVFRNEILKSNDIRQVAASLTIPGKKREYKALMKRYNAPDDEAVTLRLNGMDYDFVDLFEMELLAGRTFSRDYPFDPDTSSILTESAVRLLGFESNEDAVGKTITVPQWGFSSVVVGVINDYYQESLKKEVDPSFFFCSEGGEFFSMKVNSNDMPATIDHVEASWKKAFPGNPFEYFFLDEYFNRQYKSDEKFGNIISVFSILSIIVGCMGLFGLSLFTAQQKTKEIGIRKVLGSSVTKILVQLSWDFAKVVLIANLIAWPVTWWLSTQWLQQFANRAPVSVLYFIVAGLSVFILALITVSYQSLKAATVNPIDSLRYE